MARLVQKFGGTSVADAQCIRQAAAIAVKAVREGNEVIAVVSAMGHTTDCLLSRARELDPEPDLRELDMLLATGEQQSIALLTMAIQSLGVEARSFTGAQAGLVTDEQHGRARIREISVDRLGSILAQGKIAVVAGFQGVTSNNEITTLGRGGSDITAVALSQALGAERCDIYTDVNGVYTADPRICTQARRLDAVSYEEMLELSLAGAQVMNARSVELAMDTQVPVRVRSSFEPEDMGTLITHRLLVPDKAICGLVSDLSQDCFILTAASADTPLNGLSGLLPLLSELQAQTYRLLPAREDTLQERVFTVEKSFTGRVKSIIENLAKELGEPRIAIDHGLARISVIGHKLKRHPATAARICDTLLSARIPVEMVATSNLKVSVLVPASYAREAVTLIHAEFFPSGQAREYENSMPRDSRTETLNHRAG